MKRKGIVAVFNADDDVLELMRAALEAAGYQVVAGHLRHDDLADLVTLHEPAVIVYDVTLPYEAEWERLLELKRLPQVAERPIIVTTNNAPKVYALARTEPGIRVLSKPHAFSTLLAHVEAALRDH
jgi:DNA-binding response OmpR family regulator